MKSTALLLTLLSLLLPHGALAEVPSTAEAAAADTTALRAAALNAHARLQASGDAIEAPLKNGERARSVGELRGKLEQAERRRVRDKYRETRRKLAEQRLAERTTKPQAAVPITLAGNTAG